MPEDIATRVRKIRPVRAWILAVLIGSLGSNWAIADTSQIPNQAESVGRQQATVVACGNRSATRIHFQRKPESCTFAHRGKTYPLAVDGHSLDWKGWGRTRTKGAGRTVVNMGGFQPLVIRLRAPIRKCGHRAYSRATAYYPSYRERDSFRLDVCPR
jgi:hypothetical protein